MGFTEALYDLIGHEGGYVNDPADKGGETYKGIARRYNPQWDGWLIVDRLKVKYPMNYVAEIGKNNRLQEMVRTFYRGHYWDRFGGDKLPELVAEELLEQSVNLGTWKTAGINLQKALNLLNRDGKLFGDLTVDGIVGEKTINAVNKVSSRRLLKVLNGLQFMRYYELDPENERFVGWFDRV